MMAEGMRIPSAAIFLDWTSILNFGMIEKGQ